MDEVDVQIHNYNKDDDIEEKRHQIKCTRGKGGDIVCYERKGALVGEVNSPVIITCHDLGLNHITCFNPFINHPKMKSVLPYLHIIHIESPGHEYNAETIPEEEYPTLHEMGDRIQDVLSHFNITSFIGLGAGAGGAVLTQFAVLYPRCILGLVLIGSAIKSFGLLETVKQWVGLHTLPSFKTPQSVMNYLLNHYYDEQLMETNPDLYESIKREMLMINPANLCHYVNAFIKKNDISLDQIKALSFKVLLIVGKGSSMSEDVIELFSHFNPQYATLLQVPQCGILVTAENPSHIVEPFKLFLQGLGYLLDYYQSIQE